MQTLDVIGSLAGGITTLSYIPQIFRIWKTKSADDVSYGMYICLYIGIGLWTYYGALINAIHMIFANMLCLTFMTVIVYLKYKFKDTRVNDSQNTHHLLQCEHCNKKH